MVGRMVRLAWLPLVSCLFLTSAPRPFQASPTKLQLLYIGSPRLEEVAAGRWAWPERPARGVGAMSLSLP